MSSESPVPPRPPRPGEAAGRRFSPAVLALSVAWALVPALSLGFLTPVVIASAAVRLRSRAQGVAAGLYAAVFTAYLVLVGGGILPEGGWHEQLAMWTWTLGPWWGGTAHAFVLRAGVFRPRPAGTRPPPHAASAPPWEHPGPGGPRPSPPTVPAWEHPGPGGPQPPPPAAFTPPPSAPPSPSPSPVRTAAGPSRVPGGPPSGPFSSWDPWETSPPHGGARGARPPYGGAERMRVIGGYTLLRKLGEGGQGSVYVAAAQDGRQVAVKMLHERFRGDAGERERFLREVAAARRVPQFSTAQVIDAGVEGDTTYIVSEYVPGRSLERLVREDGPLDGGGLVRLAIATSAALKAIHSAGVVHRDFKPANVLIGPDGPRVIDFGIARALDQATATTGGFKGTPAYMSPEQVSGLVVGPESDVFSWASSMYFAATGRPPFEGTTLFQVYEAVLHHRPDLRAVPAGLRGPLTACLRKDPGERPTAAQLMLALAS
ncbi:serine/threonine-protein kinase [Planomonospora corallina]|uniref:Serine/threonine-protein kinase n=1 Tax=Planomonospora corallina TaxID=1806052 RepID=A0ABV8I5T6_9ACTN